MNGVKFKFVSFYIQQSSSAQRGHNARDTEIRKAVTTEAQTLGEPNH